LAHLEWLKQRLREQLALSGWIWVDRSRVNVMGCLAYGKHDSIKLLKWVYADPAAPCLLRKRAIWDSYAARHADWVKEPTTIYA
jgi:hypothetical protein